MKKFKARNVRKVDKVYTESFEIWIILLRRNPVTLENMQSGRNM